MADIELRFISALLRANRNTQEEFFQKQIPRSVFKIRETEIDWIYQFHERYGTYPSPLQFKAKFHEGLPKVKDPVAATIEPVLDLAMYNQMVRVSGTAKESLDKGEPIGKVLATFKSEANTLTSYNIAYSDVSPAGSSGTLTRYKQRIQPGALLYDSPWKTMNRLVHYHSPGELVGITARNSLGKTWVALKWADHYASKKIRTLIITKEMPGQQLEDRNETLRFGLDYERFREGTLTPKQMRRWHREKFKSLKSGTKNYPLFISGDETIEGVGLEHIVTKIRQYNAEVVFVDGAYLIYPEGLRKNADDIARYKYLSNRFKAMAKALKVLIVVVLQDNRNAEDKKGNSRSTNASVYGSDSWAQDVDWLWGMAGRRGADSRTMILLKGRESTVGEFNIEFQLSPRPSFNDKGIPTVVQAKTKKVNTFFRGVQ